MATLVLLQLRACSLVHAARRPRSPTGVTSQLRVHSPVHAARGPRSATPVSWQISVCMVEGQPTRSTKDSHILTQLSSLMLGHDAGSSAVRLTGPAPLSPHHFSCVQAAPTAMRVARQVRRSAAFSFTLDADSVSRSGGRLSRSGGRLSRRGSSGTSSPSMLPPARLWVCMECGQAGQLCRLLALSMQPVSHIALLYLNTS